MATSIGITVTVENVTLKSNGKYKGDFTYTQTSGSPTITDSKGNIDLSAVTGETDITFTWGTWQVEIGGALYDASYYYGDSTGNNILISEGKDSDPTQKGKNPPFSGDEEFLVNQSQTASAFTLKDKNSDGKKYAYCMVVFVNINGGAQLIDDPKIYNKNL